MKASRLLPFLLLSGSIMLTAQEAHPTPPKGGEKGVTPFGTPSSRLNGTGSTHAVVVGISNYQNSAIPDLQYADRDAEAFDAWLRSPAGGACRKTTSSFWSIKKRPMQPLARLCFR